MAVEGSAWVVWQEPGLRNQVQGLLLSGTAFAQLAPGKPLVPSLEPQQRDKRRMEGKRNTRSSELLCGRSGWFPDQSPGGETEDASGS